MKDNSKYIEIKSTLESSDIPNSTSQGFPRFSLVCSVH